LADETDSGLVFHNATIRVLWPGAPIPPLEVTANQAAMGNFTNSLIEVQGRLVNEGKSSSGEWLKLESGDQVFLAHFDLGKDNLLLPRLERGSLLRLRGVCSIRPKDTQYVGGFALLLRSAEDVDVISGAPWWSPRHLFELALAFLGIVWMAHEGRVRMVKAKFRTIMMERARVGHEMHDTLAQSFAGVAFQIQAAKSNSMAENVVLQRHLDLALKMVRHSHGEAHRSIMMLRPQALDESTNLRDALRQSIERLTEGCDLDVQFSVNGSPVGLSLHAEDVLYRVAQESVANALRHGHPRQLRVTLHYDIAATKLTVRDDGCGFDPSQLDRRGFGLPGMRQRMRAVHGTFMVTSAPGRGTQIMAEVPSRRLRVPGWDRFSTHIASSIAESWRGTWNDPMK
jgi:two-component sensor histidine kinase